MKHQKLFIILAVFFIAFLVRLSDHPANFSPVLAVALVSSYYFSKKISIGLLLAVMFVSDIFLGFYDWRLMVVVYSSLAIAGLLGSLLKNNLRFSKVISISLIGSIAFFLLTNTAVWAFSSWYPASISGLLQCFASGLPFFRNTLLGDLFFSGVFFGLIMAWEKYSLVIKNKVSVISTY
jgi:hypothetical protein